MTMIGTQTTWTTERIALLKKWVDAGLSCGQIAQEIGLSRNAIIGKINRLGLSRFKSATAAQPERNGPQKVLPRIVARHRSLRALWATPQPGFAELQGKGNSANRCTLFELQQWHCRWPISDPGAADFGFCGDKPVDGMPYCAAHARMAYRPNTRERQAG